MYTSWISVIVIFFHEEVLLVCFESAQVISIIILSFESAHEEVLLVCCSDSRRQVLQRGLEQLRGQGHRFEIHVLYLNSVWSVSVSVIDLSYY
jgi:hypothetical protein